MAFAPGYYGTPQKPVPTAPQKLAQGIGRIRPRGMGLAKLERKTPGSIRHGGRTGHFAGARRGPFAASPHNGAAIGPRRAGPKMFPPGLNRSTGYKGVDGDYSAATPQMGFMTSARGNYMGNGPE